MGIFKGQKEILAAAPHHYPAAFRNADCFYQRFGHRSFYIHTVLIPNPNPCPKLY